MFICKVNVIYKDLPRHTQNLPLSLLQLRWDVLLFLSLLKLFVFTSAKSFDFYEAAIVLCTCRHAYNILSDLKVVLKYI